MEEIKKVLECSICQEVATLPVKGVCCTNAKSLPPGCLNCVRRFYELNKKPSARLRYKVSWSGCGCSIDLTRNGSDSFYKHCFELDSIRNILGKSICYHEECKKEFETCAELRRHLNGSSTQNDKYGNCPESITKCKYCNFYDKRKIVEGRHFNEYHSYIYCKICRLDIAIINVRQHLINHQSQLLDFENEISKLNIN